MYSYGPPHMAGQKQDDQLELTYSSYVRTQDVTLKTCQRRWIIGRSGERGSGISVLAARHDDDDDDDILGEGDKNQNLFPRKLLKGHMLGQRSWLGVLNGHEKIWFYIKETHTTGPSSKDIFPFSFAHIYIFLWFSICVMESFTKRFSLSLLHSHKYISLSFPYVRWRAWLNDFLNFVAFTYICCFFFS